VKLYVYIYIYIYIEHNDFWTYYAREGRWSGSMTTGSNTNVGAVHNVA